MKPSIVLRWAVPVLLLIFVAGCTAPEEPVSEASDNPPSAAPADKASPGQPPAPVSPQPVSEPPPKAKAPAENTAAADPNGPKLVVPLKRIHFGTQPKERSLTRNFTIRNDGKSQLEIMAVEPS